MSITNTEIWNQLKHFVSVIPKKYLDALLILHQKLDDQNIKWVVNGDLAERLRVVQIEAESIEIVTSNEDVQRIFHLVQEFSPHPIIFQTRRLLRNAVIDGRRYPVYARSHYFDFDLNSVKVQVNGDLQFKVDDWDWGDFFDFTPEYVYIVGKKIAVTPLSIASELYSNLGWTDRVEKIREVNLKNHSQKIKPKLD